MFNGSNWDRKSQLSEILTEPINPRDLLQKQWRISLRLNNFKLEHDFIVLFID